jgi:hypothetical protein
MCPKFDLAIAHRDKSTTEERCGYISYRVNNFVIKISVLLTKTARYATWKCTLSTISTLGISGTNRGPICRLVAGYDVSGNLLRKRIDGRLRMSRWQEWKCAGVDDSKVLNTEYTRLAVHDSHIILLLSHLAC